MDRRHLVWLCALTLGGLAWACSKPTAGNPSTRLPEGTKMKKLWDWHGIIGTGQSLAVGVEGTPLRARQPSYRNLKLDLGSRWFPASSPDSDRLSLVPLCEPIRPLTASYPAPFPGNISGETPHTCMASQITALALAAAGGTGDYVTIHTVVGESGQALETIAKRAQRTDDTGHAYEASLFEVRAIARLAKQAGRSFGVGAITLTHGEADAENPRYADLLRVFGSDYKSDLKHITGQVTSPQLLLTQQSSCPTVPGTLALSALEALSVSHDDDGVGHGTPTCSEAPKVVCVGPRYQYEYVSDAVHLPALSYDRLGEKYGQVYFERVVLEKDWRPLEPVGAELRGDVVSVEFYVPVAPLVWDETLPRPHDVAGKSHPWAKGRGFELSVDGKPVTIDSVEIVGKRVELRSQQLAAGRAMVRYAATAAAAPRPGGTWRWGQLRDSDPFVGSTTRTKQPNHAVTFELQVP